MKKILFFIVMIAVLAVPSQAADIKISALPAVTSTTPATDVIPVVASGVTSQITVANLLSGYQVNLSLLKGTLTNSYLCTYTSSGTLLNCNTNPATFQAALTYPVTGVAAPTAGYLTKWGVSGNAIVDGPKIGTFTDTKWCSYSTSGGLACTENAPAGSGSATSTITGSGLTADKVYYMASGGLTLAKADASTTVPGICVASDATTCQFSGEYQMSASPSWTVGGLVYVSAASAGALTQTIPSTSGNQVSVIGVATAVDTVLIMPSLVVVQVP